LIGIVADNSAITMAGGLAASTSRPVALAGRLLAKVSLENGPIKIGDSLTSASSTPGVAMKATDAGRVIGIALEPFPKEGQDPSASSGQVMVFVNPHWQGGDLTVEESNDGNLVNLDSEQLRQSLASLGLVIDNEGTLIVKTIKAEVVETQGIKVQSSEIQKTGITIIDRASSEPSCFFIENGEIKIVKGECEESLNDAPPVLESPSIGEEPSSSTEDSINPQPNPPEETTESSSNEEQISDGTINGEPPQEPVEEISAEQPAEQTSEQPVESATEQ